MKIVPRKDKDEFMINLREILKDNGKELKKMKVELQPIIENLVEKQSIMGGLKSSDYVPFISEIETFNRTFNKPNNYTPTIPDEEWQSKFVYDFVNEENEELREAYESKDIVGVLDAICDLLYVAVGNATMLFGLKDKLIPAFQEVQRSNMSKVCLSQWEAEKTIELRSKEQDEPCHFEKVDDYFIVYRSRDKKVMKSINYSKPDLLQFFTQEELLNSSK